MDPPPTYGGTPLRAGGIRLSPEAQMVAVQILTAAFADPGARKAPLDKISPNDQAAFKTCRSSNADVYGEISPGGLLDMLWRVGARPGDRFYDLGAGAGRATCLAWLCGLGAVGVELAIGRWRASQKALTFLASCARSGAGVHDNALSLDCLHGNALDLDFTDADIVFMNSVMFSPQMMTELSATARRMKPGSHIISFLPVYGGHFKPNVPYLQAIGEIWEPTSWNLRAMFRVFRVACNPPGIWEKPHSLRRYDELVGSICSVRWSMLTFSRVEADAPKEHDLSNEFEDVRELPLALPKSQEKANLHIARCPGEAQVILALDSETAFCFDDLGRTPLHCIALRSSSETVSEMFGVFREYAPTSVLEEDLQTCLTPYLMVPMDHRVAVEPSGWAAIACSLEPPSQHVDAAAFADAWIGQGPLELLGTARLSDHLFAGCSSDHHGHDSTGEEMLRLVIGPAIVAALRLAHALGNAERGGPAFAEFVQRLLKVTRGPNFAAFDPRGPYRPTLMEVVGELRAETCVRLTVAMHALYEKDEDGYISLRDSALGGKYRNKAFRPAAHSREPSLQTPDRDEADKSALQSLEMFTRATLSKCGLVIARGENFFWKTASSRRKFGDVGALILLDKPTQVQKLVDGLSVAKFASDGLELQDVWNGFNYADWSPELQYEMLNLGLSVRVPGSPNAIEVMIDLKEFHDIRHAGLLTHEFARGAFDHFHLASKGLEIAAVASSRVRVLLQEMVATAMAQALIEEDSVAFDSAYTLGLLGGVSEEVLGPAFGENYKLMERRHGHGVLEDQAQLRRHIRADVLGPGAA